MPFGSFIRNLLDTVTGLKKRRRAAAASAAEVEVGREASSMAEDEEEGEKPPQTPAIAVHAARPPSAADVALKIYLRHIRTWMAATPRQAREPGQGPTAPIPIVLPLDRFPVPQLDRQQEMGLELIPGAVLAVFGSQEQQMFDMLADRERIEELLRTMQQRMRAERIWQEKEEIARAEEARERELDAMEAEEGSDDEFDPFYTFDEDCGIADPFEPPAEMPESMCDIPYELLIEGRSRRSGNERVHPSMLRGLPELRLPAGRRAEINGEEADDEAEEAFEDALVHEDTDNEDEDNGEATAGGETAVIAAALEMCQPRSFRFQRKIVAEPHANKFRRYRMMRAELQYQRSLIVDAPRALDDDEFEAMLDALGLQDRVPAAHPTPPPRYESASPAPLIPQSNRFSTN